MSSLMLPYWFRCLRPVVACSRWRKLRQLRSSDTFTRKLAARRLRGDPRAVGALIGALADADRQVRIEAMQSLDSSVDPRVDGALVEALSDPCEEVCALAARSLGTRRAAAAAGPLVALLEKLTSAEPREWRVARQAAAAALGQIGERAACPALAGLLTDADQAVRAAAAGSLAALGWEPAGSAERLHHAFARGDFDEMARFGEAAVPLLEGVLKATWPLAGPDTQTRVAAALGQIGGAGVAAILCCHLEEVAVEEALVRIGQQAVAPLVTRIETPPGPTLQRTELRIDTATVQAICILGRIGDPGAVGPLVRKLSATSEVSARVLLGGQAIHLTSWSAAARALAQLGTPAVAGLVEALSSREDAVRWGALWALRAMAWKPGDASERAAEAAALGDRDRLAGFGKAAIGALLRAQSFSLHWPQGASRSVELPIEVSWKVLEERLLSLRADTKLLSSLGSAHPGHLVVYLTDGEGPARKAALRALDDIGWKAATAAEARALAFAQAFDPDRRLDSRWPEYESLSEVLAWAAERGGELTAAAPLLRSATHFRDERDRILAVALMARSGDQSLGPVLAGLLEDPNAEVRSWAAWAVRKICFRDAAGALASVVEKEALDGHRSAHRTGPSMKSLSRALGDLAGPAGLEPLLKALRAGLEVDAKALAACGSAAVEPLAELLRNPDEGGRVKLTTVLWALGSIGTAPALDLLASRLDGEPLLADLAAEELCRNGDGRGAERVIALLEKPASGHYWEPTLTGLEVVLTKAPESIPQAVLTRIAALKEVKEHWAQVRPEGDADVIFGWKVIEHDCTAVRAKARSELERRASAPS